VLVRHRSNRISIFELFAFRNLDSKQDRASEVFAPICRPFTGRFLNRRGDWSQSCLIMFKSSEEGMQPFVTICLGPAAERVSVNFATPITAPFSLQTGAPLEPIAKSAVISIVLMSRLVVGML